MQMQDRRDRLAGMRASRVHLFAAARALTLSILACTLGGCQYGVLNPAGPVGSAERIILLDSLAIMLAIVIPTIFAIIAFAWWFRASNTKARYRPTWSYSGQLELLVWSIPALVVIFLGGIGWVSSHDLDPAQPLASHAKPIEVEVVSLDWKWLFIYPDEGVASVNHLVVPSGVPIHFSLTSGSVMNSFFVPQLGSQIYTMAGMATQLNLQADQPGSYAGLSAQFSGDGFSDMRFQLDATSDANYRAFIASAKKSGDALDASSYKSLSVQSQTVAVSTYRSVAPDLFNAIVAMQIPPAPGPQQGAPSADVSPRTAPQGH